MVRFCKTTYLGFSQGNRKNTLNYKKLRTSDFIQIARTRNQKRKIDKVSLILV